MNLKQHKKNYHSVLILLTFICLFLSGCKSTQYVPVPVEAVKIEYIDRQHRDSIHITDLVYIRAKGDTVWLTRWRAEYKDRLIRDSVILRDSIPVPYPVEVVREVEKELNWFDRLRLWLGNVLLIGMAGYTFGRIIKKGLSGRFLFK